MSLITPELLGSRGQQLPGRESVRVYQQLPRDEFASPFEVIAEIKPEMTKETGGPDASTKSVTRVFVFYQPELGARVLKQFDIIQYGTKFYRVDDVNAEQLNTKIRCNTTGCASPLNDIE